MSNQRSELIKAFQAGQVTLFVGPQPARLMAVPTVADFTQKLFDQHASSLEAAAKGPLQAWLDQGEWSRVCEHFKRNQSAAYEAALIECFDRSASLEEAPHWLRILHAMQPARIFSANPDNLLAQLFKSYLLLTWQDQLLLPDLCQHHAKRHLMQIYGQVSDPASLVLSHSQQGTFQGEEGRPLRDYLSYCLEHQLILLVGFDCDDPLLLWLLKHAKQEAINPNWYLLLAEGQAAPSLLPPEDASPSLGLLHYATDEGLLAESALNEGLNQWWANLAREAGYEVPPAKLASATQSPGYQIIDQAFLNGLPAPDQKQVRAYYQGSPASWQLIQHGHSVKRGECDQVLALIDKGERLVLLTGPGGEGKSTVMKQIGLRFAAQGIRVLEITRMDAPILSIIKRQTGKLAVLLSQADRNPQLARIVQHINTRLGLSYLVLSARPHEWEHAQRSSEALLRNISQVSLARLNGTQAFELAEKLIASGLPDQGDAALLAQQILTKTDRILYASMLEATHGKDLKHILADVVGQLAGWHDGKLLLRALGLVSTLETLTIGSDGWSCGTDLFCQVLDLEAAQVDSLCQRLRGEVQLKPRGQRIRSRHPVIAKALFEVLFHGNPAHLDEVAFNVAILEAIGTLLANDPKTRERDLLTILPNRYIKAERWDDAERLLDVASKTEPNHAPTWQMWALLAKQRGRIGSLREPRSARWLFHRATQADPSHAPSWQAWGLMEAEEGNAGDVATPFTARWLFQQGVQATDADAALWWAWARLEYDFDPNKALEWAEKGLAHDPNHPPLKMLKRDIRDSKPLPSLASKGKRARQQRATRVTAVRPQAEPALSEYQYYLAAKQLADQAQVTTDDALAALSELTPLLEKPYLERAAFKLLEDDPVCMLILDEPEKSERSVFVATTGGALIRFQLPKEVDSTCKPKPEPIFQIEDFKENRDQVLGLYTQQNPFRSQHDIFLICRYDGHSLAYQFGQGQEKANHLAGNQVPAWMQVCPVNFRPNDANELAEDLSQHATSAVFTENKLWFTSTEMFDGGFTGDFINQIGDVLLVARPNQSITAYWIDNDKGPRDLKQAWQWFPERQPLCFYPLPVETNTMLIGQAGGRFVVAQSVDKADSLALYDKLSRCIHRNEDCSDAASLNNWVAQYMKDKLQSWPHGKRAPKLVLLRLLLDSLLNETRSPSAKQLTEVMPLFRRLYRQEDFLHLMPSIRKTIRSWDKSQRPEGAAIIHALYVTLPYRQQDFIDLELDRHVQRRQAGASVEGNDLYAILCRRPSVNRIKLLHQQRMKEDSRVALWAEGYLDQFVLEYTKRPVPEKKQPKKKDGVLRRVAGKNHLYWFLEDRIYRVTHDRENSIGPIECEANFHPVVCVPVYVAGKEGILLANSHEICWFDPEKEQKLYHKQLPGKMQLIHAATAADDLVFLITLQAPARGRHMTTRLWRISEGRIQAENMEKFHTPSELTAIQLQNRNSWLMASNVYSFGIEIDQITRQSQDALVLKVMTHRKLKGRVRALAKARLANKDILIVGTTEGYLHALNLDDSSEGGLSPFWLRYLGSAVCHLDVICQGDGYKVLALTANTDAVVLGSQGSVLWSRQLHTTHSSGAFFVAEGQLFVATTDARGALTVFRQGGQQASRDFMWAAYGQISSHKKYNHDEIEALKYVTNPGSVTANTMHLHWSASARALLVKGLCEHLAQEHTYLLPFIQEVVPHLNLEELALVVQMDEQLPFAQELIVAILENLQNQASRPAPREKHWLEGTVCLLENLILVLGRALITPQWVASKGAKAWHLLEPEVGQHCAVFAAILSKCPRDSDHRAYFSHLVEQTTYLGPKGFEALPLIAPTSKSELAEYLHLVIVDLGEPRTKIWPFWKARFGELILKGPTKVFVGMLNLLVEKDKKTDWFQITEVATLAAKHQNQFHKLHPGLRYFLGLLLPFAAKQEVQLRSVRDQLNILNEVEAESPKPLPASTGPWQDWLRETRERFNRIRHEAIGRRRALLQSLCRVRLDDLKMKRLVRNEALFSVRLYREGEPAVGTRVTLELTGSALHPDKGLSEEAWGWDQVPSGFQWRLQIGAGQELAIRVRTFSDDHLHEDTWTHTLPPWQDSASDCLLEECPALVPIVLQQLKGLKTGFYILAYDEDLGLPTLLAQLLERGCRLVDVDTGMSSLGYSRANPMGFQAETLLEKLGAKRSKDGKWYVQLAQGVHTVLAHQALETTDRLLSPEHRAVLTRFKDFLIGLHGVPIYWLLPLEQACRLQVALQQHSRYLPLYKIDPNEADTQNTLRAWLAQGTVPDGEIANIIQGCQGNLRLLAHWRKEPLAWRAFIRSDTVHRLLRQECLFLEQMTYINLVVLAHTTIAIRKAEWLEDMYTVNVPRGFAQGLYVQGYRLNQAGNHVSKALQGLRDMGATRREGKRQASRSLLAQRGVLQRTEQFIYLLAPYREWLEQRNLVARTPSALVEDLMGQTLAQALDLRAMAAAGQTLKKVFPRIAATGSQLLEALAKVLDGSFQGTNLNQVITLLTGLERPLTPAAQDPQAKVFINDLKDHIKLSHLYLLPTQKATAEPGTPRLHAWIGFLDNEPAQGLETLEQTLAEAPFTLILLGPGVLGASSEYNDKLCILNERMLVEISTAPNPAEAFYLTLRNRMGLLRFSPFQVGNALPQASPVFVGRESEKATIREHLDTRSFMILGGRQIGKTSLLHDLLDMLKDEPNRTILYLDCQGVYSAQDFAARLKQTFEAAHLTWLENEQAILAIEASLAGLERPLLMLNEVDGLALKGWPLLQRLRSLSEQRRCQFIMVGYQGAFGGIQHPRHPFYHWLKGDDFSKTFVLGALSRQAAEQLVNRLSDSDLRLRWEDEQTRLGGTAHILERSHRIPILIQSTCHELVRKLHLSRRTVITRADLVGDAGRPVYPAWDYLASIRISLQAGQLSSSQPPDQEYMGKLILAVLVHELYFKRADRPIEDPALREKDAKGYGFEVGEVLAIMSPWLKANLRLRARLEARFSAQDYEQFLNLWSLTVILSVHPDKTLTYFFQDHVYPLEFNAFLRRESLSIDAYIRNQIRYLDLVLERQEQKPKKVTHGSDTSDKR